MIPQSSPAHKTLARRRRAPDWSEQILELDGDGPWCSVTSALPYLPVETDKAYRMLNAYDRRIKAARGRGRLLTDLSVLDARDNELPCVHEGRGFRISKRLLIRKYAAHLQAVE